MKNENLANIIIWKYPELKPFTDYILQQDNETEGPYLKEWNVNLPRPSEKEIMSFEQEWLDWKKSIAYKELRRNAILDEWPVHEQLEAITELEMGLPEKLKELLEHIKKVK